MALINVNGERITKQDFRQRCGQCLKSKEPGWLSIGNDDWVECPFCKGNGWITGTETKIDPTRKIFIISSGG